MRSEAARHADFSVLRYGQVWEDADVLLEGLAVRPGDACLSIASAGDNAIALLTQHPARVVAIDLSPAQIACLALRVAAYRVLGHRELLELVGSRPSTRRRLLYARCRPALDRASREYWDRQGPALDRGLGGAGRFERYLAAFRACVLPLVHDGPTVATLLRRGRNIEARRFFYMRQWNTWRWRLLFRLFFSRGVMGSLGRDPAFFRHVDTRVAPAILERTERALTTLDPAENAFVRWILTGSHGDALPHALRPEHFDTIRGRLDRLEWHCASLEEYLGRSDAGTFARFNLSDVFEYVSHEHYHRMLDAVIRRSTARARLVYWNMLVPRRRPDHLASRLRPLDDVAGRLHARDRGFFYMALRVEEVQ
jgi:S-adenosylmethionine-diacylglycerol 3-amino-3-carboxypropyl transferase